MNEVPQSATSALSMRVWDASGMLVVCSGIRMFLRLNKSRITAWLCGFSYVLQKNVRKNVRKYKNAPQGE
jgi:hypothetical protein